MPSLDQYKGGLTIVGAICARGGSKGVPRKNLRYLAGKPLIVHTILCARACPIFDRVVISTDDDEIAAVARQHDAEVPFLRPSHLAQDDSPKWEVFRHLVQHLEAKSGERVDVLVDLDTGVPLRQPADIAGCVEQLLSSGAEVVATAYAAERNPYFNMVELGADGFATIVKPPAQPIANRQSAPQVYSLSPAVYAMVRDVLWQYEHWSEAKLQIYPLPRERAIDIDSEFDLALVEYLLHARKTGK
jgi:N-acylneuraminate cytidylyltransferase/CMP-N,N'-diacetyllegionaminic acid synthase